MTSDDRPVRAYRHLGTAEYLVELGDEVYVVCLLERSVSVAPRVDLRCSWLVGQLHPDVGVAMGSAKVRQEPDLEVSKSGFTFTDIQGRRVCLRFSKALF